MSTAHRHHVDGRFGRGLGYVAPDLVILLSPAEHRELHQVLRDLDAERQRPGEALLLHRARRHLITHGWSADAGRALTFDPGADRALQQLWLGVVEALEGRS